MLMFTKYRPSYDNKIKKYGRSVVSVPELRNGQNIFVEKTESSLEPSCN
jgi:hypothetical protein